MRVSRKMLELRLAALNNRLSMPAEQFSSKVGEPTKFSIGHFCIEHNAQGYQLQRQLSDAGGTEQISEYLSAGELHRFICGMLQGIKLARE